MKILVFDDSPLNQKSARVQLKEHDLTVAGDYDEADKLLGEKTFDVFMTDLMVPAMYRGGAASKYEGQEMPLGSIIALRALSVGIKMVALVTDTNHHDHPASAAIDPFDGWAEKTSQVGDAKLYCTNFNVNGLFNAETFEQIDMNGSRQEVKTVWAKDWAKVLKTLTK